MLLDTATPTPTEELFNRNFIDGEWVFPAAPYDYEIRNPADSTITAAVPLSSRVDVGRAIAAAHQSQTGSWADPRLRNQLLAELLSRLAVSAPELARLQTTETGLGLHDSARTIDVALRLARTILTRNVVDALPPNPGVSGHVLSWGLPFTETLVNVFSALTRGKSVVVKPSLRAPLTPVAVALAASRLNFPPGVFNIVQGTGVDVGAALIGSPLLSQLHVHGNPNTLSRARRAGQRTGVPSSTLSAGGNAMIVYPDVGPDEIRRLTSAAASAVRIHSTGGPFGLPIVAVHSAVALVAVASIMDEVGAVVTAPLPSEPLRSRAMNRLELLRDGGGQILLGGTIPDDAEHRMGWRIPPTVVDLGDADAAAPVLRAAGEPLGPILTLVRWTNHHDLDAIFADHRHRDGYAGLWGDSFDDERIRFGVQARERSALEAASDGLVPVAWMGEKPLATNGVRP